MTKETNNYILKISCPDKAGIIAAISNFLFKADFNISESSQFKDPKNSRFFMRVSFYSFSDKIKYGSVADLKNDFNEIANKFEMNFEFFDAKKKPRILIMVSKFGHCLNNLLYQWKIGSISAEIPLIVSNHMDLEQFVMPYNLNYIHMPITEKNKNDQEDKLFNLIKKERIDLVVLARYMQILSPNFCKKLEGKIINIHHSFLPSFKGAKPYEQAFLKGVKIIGATAHYVTDKLDEGQIIEQDVARVDHTKLLKNFVSIGRDIESVVLSKAINWHLEHRIIINENRTVVFN